jgi:hypothetical protein
VSVLAEYDHLDFRDRPAAEHWREVPEVPRVGETVTVFGKVYVVYNVHWWEQPVTDGDPAVRVVLRTPQEYHRSMAQ